jgi:phospholipid transport system transporter-binding protein
VIRRDGRRMFVGGPVTLANVATVVEEGRRHLHEGVRAVDLSEVTDLDSSLLAALLTWLRDARVEEHELTFANLPEALQTISRLYGVDGLLPAAQTGARTAPPPRH